MKKLVGTADLGGAPFNKADLRTLFNSEIWEAMESLLSPFLNDAEGLILTGCVITNNAGNFDMTAGIVFTDGEFRRVAAVTNKAFPQYIVSLPSSFEARTFSDGISHNLIDTISAVISDTPSGQSITINSLTGADDRRWAPTISSSRVLTKVIPIGDWNMDTTATLPVTHGLNYKKIISVDGVIRSDDDANYYPMNYYSSGNTPSWGVATTMGSTTITLVRVTGGVFDDPAYDSTSFNRGYLLVTYMV